MRKPITLVRYETWGVRGEGGASVSTVSVVWDAGAGMWRAGGLLLRSAREVLAVFPPIDGKREPTLYESLQQMDPEYDNGMA